MEGAHRSVGELDTARRVAEAERQCVRDVVALRVQSIQCNARVSRRPEPMPPWAEDPQGKGVGKLDYENTWLLLGQAFSGRGIEGRMGLLRTSNDTHTGPRWRSRGADEAPLVQTCKRSHPVPRDTREED